MCASSSGSDSTPVLWGEINVESNPHNAENLWKPIHEYQNIKQERDFASQNYPSVDEPTSEMKKKQLCYDPVGQHMIQLRQSCYELNELLLNAQMDHKNKVKCKKTKLPSFSLPEFPANKHSFEASCKSSPKLIACGSSLQENQVKGQIKQFVKQVLAETGYYVGDSHSTSAISCLSDVTDKFLTGFISLLKFHEKSFSKKDDLWGPLETTLYEIEFGGIHGLHKFSSERLLRHDALLKECEDMLERYEKFRSDIK